jgi:hypothetical protein
MQKLFKEWNRTIYMEECGLRIGTYSLTPVLPFFHSNRNPGFGLGAEMPRTKTVSPSFPSSYVGPLRSD